VYLSRAPRGAACARRNPALQYRNRQQKSGSDGRVPNCRLFRSTARAFAVPSAEQKKIRRAEKIWLPNPGSSAAILLRPSCGKEPVGEAREERSAREAGKGCEGAVEPPVRGGRWAEPRSGRARSVVQPGPRHPAQAARLDSPRAGRSLVIAAEESGEKRRTRGVELVLLGRLQVSLGCLRPRHLCRTLRVEWGHRSSPVGLGLSAAPGRARAARPRFCAPSAGSAGW
jgi:hypothetical protein